MLKVSESGLEFSFRVKAYNYDAQGSVYEKNRFCHSSAVDFLALSQKDIFFIEVKEGEFFNTTLEKLDDKVCKIYRNFLDSVALVSLSKESEILPYQTRLYNKTPKFILVIAKDLPPDMMMLYYEKIRKNLRKKLKRADAQIEFMLQTPSRYNEKLYTIKPVL